MSLVKFPKTPGNVETENKEENKQENSLEAYIYVCIMMMQTYYICYF